MAPFQLILVAFITIFAFLLGKWITHLLLKQKLSREQTTKDDFLLFDQQARHIKDSLESLYIKLEEYSKEVLSKLDTKILILHELLLDAEKKISMLHDLMKTTQPQINNTQKSEIQEIHEKVYNLYKEGLKPSEIAKQLNLQVSEVSLILALKNIPIKQQ